MAVFGIDESRLEAGLVFLRQFVEAAAHAVGREIDLRDGGQRPEGDRKADQREEGDEHPLEWRGSDPRGPLPSQEDQDGQHEQHHVLDERLGIGQMDGFAEAAAVADGVEAHQVEGQDRKEGRQDEGDPRHDAQPQAAEHADADEELERGQGDAQHDGPGIEKIQVHETQILVDDQAGADRIEELQNA